MTRWTVGRVRWPAANVYNAINNFAGGFLNAARRRSLILDYTTETGGSAGIFLVHGAPEFPAEDAYVTLPAGTTVLSGTAHFDFGADVVSGVTTVYLTIWDAVDFSTTPDPGDPGFSILHEDSVVASVGASTVDVSLSVPVVIPVGGAWISASGETDQSFLFFDEDASLTFTWT